MIDPVLVDQLAASQKKVAGWIRQHASDRMTPSAPGAWSLRDVAAHLAATEIECVEPRVRAIASGSRPRFAFYSNDKRDFSSVHLEAALAEWAATRSRLLDYVRTLSAEDLTRVGVHSRFGAVSVARYLGIALDHELGHLHDLEREASELAR